MYETDGIRTLNITSFEQKFEYTKHQTKIVSKINKKKSTHSNTKYAFIAAQLLKQIIIRV